jgi:hypothetical protein
MDNDRQSVRIVSISVNACGSEIEKSLSDRCRSYGVANYLLGVGDIRTITRSVFFDCTSGKVAKIFAPYDRKIINIDAPPKSKPFQIMYDIACTTRLDSI